MLTLLREEFPDITISKIRFLESQGLVNPERSPSGYRKFYDHDVERLRWVLRQQREHFLPLKVIRDRLVAEGKVAPTGAAEPAVATEEGAATGAVAPADVPAARHGPARSPQADDRHSPLVRVPAETRPVPTHVGTNGDAGSLPAAEPALALSPVAAMANASGGAHATSEVTAEPEPALGAAPAPDPRPATPTAATPTRPRPVRPCPSRTRGPRPPPPRPPPRPTPPQPGRPRPTEAAPDARRPHANCPRARRHRARDAGPHHARARVQPGAAPTPGPATPGRTAGRGDARGRNHARCGRARHRAHARDHRPPADGRWWWQDRWGPGVLLAPLAGFGRHRTRRRQRRWDPDGPGRRGRAAQRGRPAASRPRAEHPAPATARADRPGPTDEAAPAPGTSSPSAGTDTRASGDVAMAVPPAPRPPARHAAPPGGASPVATGASGVSLTLDELSAATGLSADETPPLQSFSWSAP